MPRSFTVFFGVWIALGIASAVFYKKASYATKKAAHPFLMILTGGLFLGFAEWIFQGRLPWPFIIVVCVIMYLNYRCTRFCPQCSATLRARFTRWEFCPRCGAKLEQ